MLGAGALVNGLGGASPNPEENTAADLLENSSENGNGSAQLSVDDLASGSHDPAMQGTSPAAATAPVSSASLPLPPQQQFQQVPKGYTSLPMPGSHEVSFTGAAAPFVPSQMYPAVPNYGQQPQQVVSTAPVASVGMPDQQQPYNSNGYPAAHQMQPGFQQQFQQQIPQQTSNQHTAGRLSPIPLFVPGQVQGPAVPTFIQLQQLQLPTTTPTTTSSGSSAQAAITPQTPKLTTF